MDQYLTDRAKRRLTWQYALIAPLGIFIAAFFSVALDYAREGDRSGTALSLVLAGLFLWPVVHMFRGAYCRNRARAFARGIERASKTVIPLEEACRMDRHPISEKELKFLVNRGYFKSFHVDFENRKVYLPVVPKPSEDPAPLVRIVTCPSCGARNRLVVGKICRCEYCDRELDGTES